MATPHQIDLSATASHPGRIPPNLDPMLQLIIARRQTGTVKPAGTDTNEDEVAVIARVSDPAAWEALSEVRTATVLGRADEELGGFIVGGRIPVRRIESVRSQPFVLSLKASRPLKPMLAATTHETGAQPAQLPAGHQSNGGAGTVVGVIDYGCDFAHKNFRNADGTTRLLSLWDQDGPATAASPHGYGRVHSAADINLALQQANPYAALGYSPEPVNPNSTGTHGTHVLDIAAGNGHGSGTPGMAPAADIIFVDVSHADIAFQGVPVVGQSFGDSLRLLEALVYIFDQAGTRPCVINISLGTNGGPHDGTTLVEQGIDSRLRAVPNRAVTLAASNSFTDGIHAAGTVVQGQSVDLRWELLTTPTSDVELEVWYAGTDRFTVDLVGPNGATLATVAPGAAPATLTANGTVAALVANRLDDPNNRDNNIGIFLAADMPAGTYTVRLHGDTVTDGRYHAWIERDNDFQSQFTPPHDNTHTVGSISCGRLPLVVGSYDAHKATLPLSFFSSAGPTRDGREKPDVAAPGHEVLAAKSRTGTGTVRKSGTSMAAPAVAGLVALVFSEARARGRDLTADQLRAVVIDAARRNPPAGTTWDDRFGHGRVSATAAIQTIIDGTEPPPAPPPQPAGNAATSGGGGGRGRATRKTPATKTRK